MSESFDKPDRPAQRPARGARDPYGRDQGAAFDPYRQQEAFYEESLETTQPASQASRPNPLDVPPVGVTRDRGAPVSRDTPSSAVRGENLIAEARREMRNPASAAIVPPGSVTGRSLTLVVGIMCFLACLTAGTVYLINRSAEAWLKDMAAEITVQIEPRDGSDTERTISDVTAILKQTPGITNVRPLSLQESSGLLEPWLGQAEVLKTLPVPRLIAVEIDPRSPPDLEALKRRFGASSAFKGVLLDDHRHWQQQIRTVTRSLALGGLLILLMVAAATIAIIVSATRSAMASNSDIVEVLHFVGATDRFIAREFDKHFLKLGIKAGCVGAIAAATLFLTAPTVVGMIGGQSVTSAEIQRLLGSGSLDLAGYAILGLVVVVVAGLCMVTSRLGVFNILNARS
jgi:cell division transport system permease protein